MTQQDEEHLRLLSLFHYILSGITALFALFPVIHLAVGLFLILSPRQPKDPPPEAGWFFVIIASVFILVGLCIAVLLLLTGRFLSKRRHYLFCLVVACIECMFAPLGTVLGIFTIIVLIRESVKAAFEEQPNFYADPTSSPDMSGPA